MIKIFVYILKSEHIDLYFIVGWIYYVIRRSSCGLSEFFSSILRKLVLQMRSLCCPTRSSFRKHICLLLEWTAASFWCKQAGVGSRFSLVRISYCVALFDLGSPADKLGAESATLRSCLARGPDCHALIFRERRRSVTSLAILLYPPSSAVTPAPAKPRQLDRQTILFYRNHTSK